MPQSKRRQPFRRTALPTLPPVEIISQVTNAHLLRFLALAGLGSGVLINVGLSVVLRGGNLGELEIILTLRIALSQVR